MDWYTIWWWLVGGRGRRSKALRSFNAAKQWLETIDLCTYKKGNPCPLYPLFTLDLIPWRYFLLSVRFELLFTADHLLMVLWTFYPCRLLITITEPLVWAFYLIIDRAGRLIFCCLLFIPFGWTEPARPPQKLASYL